jgi:hypothetical protein
MAPPVFKVGDRVRYKPSGALGTIISGPETARGKNYDVAFDEGTVLGGIRYGPTTDLLNPDKDKWHLGPVCIYLENLEPA